MGFGFQNTGEKEAHDVNNYHYDVEEYPKGGTAVVTDEVFGAITEGGPNYRSVRHIVLGLRKAPLTTGRMARYRGAHDEDADGSRCAFDARGL